MNKVAIKIIFLFLLISPSINSQSLSDSLKAKKFRSIAKNFRSTNDYDSAILYSQKAVKIYFLLANKTNKKYYWNKYIYSKCDFSLALEKQGINYDLAISNLKSVLSVSIDHFGEFSQPTSSIYYYLGIIYRDTWSLNLSEEYLWKSIKIKENTLGKNHISLAKIYGYLSIVYNEKDEIDKSIKCNLKEFNLREKNGSKKINKANFFTGLGFIHEYNKNFELSVHFHKKAFNIYKELYGRENPKMNNYYNNLGIAQYLNGEYEEGISNLLISLELIKINLGIKHRYVAVFINYIIDAYKRKGDYYTALKFCQQAFYANSKNFDKTNNIYRNPQSLDDHFDSNYLLETLKYKAEILTKTGSINDLRFAFKTYLSADKLIDIINSKHFKESDKIALSKHSRKVYSGAIQLCWLLSKKANTKKERKYYENQAFYFSEKSKASVLLSSLLASSAKKFGGIPDSLLEKEDSLKIQKALYQQKQLKTKDSIQQSIYNNKVFEINRKHENLIALYERKFPKYFNLKHNKHYVSINQLQNKLKNNQTIIEYYISDSSLFTFLVKKDTFKLLKSDIVIPIAELVNSLNKSLEAKNIESFSQLSHDLYQLLIKPIENDIKNKDLLIVNDGPLSYLSFDLLINEMPNKIQFNKFSYLIENHSINYFYSANLFFQSHKEQLSENKFECLAFSFSNNDFINKGELISMRSFRKKGLVDLPGSRKEIAAISNILDGDYYYGTYANERNFKEKAKDYKILHLALHGDVDHKQPLNSKLYFTDNNKTDTSIDKEDNNLHAFELYNMKLNADLVVLSACNTGVGKLENGEGVMSLGRAFTYAGCKSVVMSQWKLSDFSTPIIMENFYKNLKNGLSKSESLRQSKLSYLKTADNLMANPLYWAGLIQVGNSNPIISNNNRLNNIFLAASILVLAGIILILIIKWK